MRSCWGSASEPTLWVWGLLKGYRFRHKKSFRLIDKNLFEGLWRKSAGSCEVVFVWNRTSSKKNSQDRNIERCPHPGSLKKSKAVGVRFWKGTHVTISTRESKKKPWEVIVRFDAKTVKDTGPTILHSGLTCQVNLPFVLWFGFLVFSRKQEVFQVDRALQWSCDDRVNCPWVGTCVEASQCARKRPQQLSVDTNHKIRNSKGNQIPIRGWQLFLACVSQYDQNIAWKVKIRVDLTTVTNILSQNARNLATTCLEWMIRLITRKFFC